MYSLIFSIISLIFSGTSVVVSMISLLANRSMLIFFGDDDLVPMAITRSELTAIYTDKKGNKHKVPFTDGILYHIQVFNPSPSDIAYFHMHYVIDDQMPKDVWTQKSFGWVDSVDKKVKVVMYDPIKGSGEIPIPDSPQGVFKAHSFTPLYVFLNTEDSPFPKKVKFTFKYAVRKFPYLGKHHRYKTFSADLDISNVQAEIRSKTKAMQQLTGPVQKSIKSKQTPPYKTNGVHKKRK